MIQKKNRFEQAKLARAYMKGGFPPYQAARKCGFVRVSLMEEAIRELEAHEKLENPPELETTTAQESDDSAYLPNAQTTFDTKPTFDAKPAVEVKPEPVPKPEPRPFYKPLQNWRNEKASVSYYGPNDSLAPMYRLMLEGRNQYLNIPESSIKDVVSLLCEAAGLNGPESSDGPSKQELAILNDALTRENVALCKRLTELKHQPDDSKIAKLEVELAAAKAELTDLKLKVFDKLIAMV